MQRLKKKKGEIPPKLPCLPGPQKKQHLVNTQYQQMLPGLAHPPSECARVGVYVLGPSCVRRRAPFSPAPSPPALSASSPGWQVYRRARENLGA